MSVDLIGSLPRAFTHATAQATGLSDRDLRRLRDSGRVERLARGIYVQHPVDADPDLIEIALRSEEATLCLTSALAHHDLIDDIPASIHVALPRARRSPKTAASVTWHRFDAGTFQIGRGMLELTDDLSVGLYDAARSIVDAYRLRHLYGIDQAHEALKRWLRRSGSQPSALLATAGHFPKAVPVIRTTLEALL